MAGHRTSTSLFTVTEDMLSPGAGAEGRLGKRLTRGQILVFPPGLLTLPNQDDLEFLRNDLGSAITLKNISFHPDGDYITGIKKDQVRRERTARILRAHNQEVQKFLTRIVPEYCKDWRIGKVNYRPLQEKGRELSRHSSNEMIHTDAFPSGATHGDRILRFFTNVHPSEPRRWKSSGLMPDLLEEFGEAAGIKRQGDRSLNPGLLGRAFSGTLRTLKRAGIPQAELVDSSPYDRAMLRLHDYLKDDDDFQADISRMVEVEFPPLHSWAVLTDLVSHGVIGGQHALVNTFYLRREHDLGTDIAPVDAMRRWMHGSSVAGSITH